MILTASGMAFGGQRNRYLNVKQRRVLDSQHSALLKWYRLPLRKGYGKVRSP